MNITYKVSASKDFNNADLENFLGLLIEQAQVQNPTVEKLKSCPYLCIAFENTKPIAIGAIKQVYKAPFTKAGVHELSDLYNYELGYLYVVHNPEYRGRGIAKSIIRVLIGKVSKENIFATTEESDKNPMKYILEKLNFNRVGKVYIGQNTGKKLGLYVLTVEK